jgi:dihydropteroate synthase
MTVCPPTSPHSGFSDRAQHWQLRSQCLAIPNRPLLMGIVNVTPDSFSDGGEFLQTEQAVEHALSLFSHGADLLDIGGESTRPYSDPVSLQEELDRVVPVVEQLRAREDVLVSVDTSKAEVAKECLAHGVEIINDVTGLCGDAAMVPLAVESRAGVCVMHMQGTPQTMQDAPVYKNVVEDVLDFLRTRRDALVEAGVLEDRICIDPGIGFGKTLQDNLQLLQQIDVFHLLGCPVLVGHSRKGFIKKVLQAEVGLGNVDLEAGTLGLSLALAGRGVQILRLHDVQIVRQALVLFGAASSC